MSPCLDRAPLSASLSIAIAAFLALACLTASAAPLKLYVSPKGRDTWSGKSSLALGGDGPFATIERARDWMAQELANRLQIASSDIASLVHFAEALVGRIQLLQDAGRFFWVSCQHLHSCIRGYRGLWF